MDSQIIIAEMETVVKIPSERGDDSSTEDPSAVCAACLDGIAYEDDEILTCDNCKVAVHQSCYSMSTVPERSPW